VATTSKTINEENQKYSPKTTQPAAYWSDRKRDLFATMRQLGKPTVFLSMSANEIGWTDLIKTLHRLRNNGLLLSDEEIKTLNYFEKTTLVNEDAVTCAI